VVALVERAGATRATPPPRRRPFSPGGNPDLRCRKPEPALLDPPSPVEEVEEAALDVEACPGGERGFLR
jgi:hypothetical protein